MSLARASSWAGLAVLIVTIVGAVAYVGRADSHIERNAADITQLDRRMTAVERDLSTSMRVIADRLGRIEGALGVKRE